MKKAVIVGAGQMGLSVSKLINPNKIELLAFADNNPGKWSEHSNPPVLSFKSAIELSPDFLIISITGDDRISQIRTQITDYGFEGQILVLNDLMNCFDIRSRTLSYLSERIGYTVSGAIAELGVYRGDLAWQLNLLFPDRSLYLFDTFEGFSENDLAYESNVQSSRNTDFRDTSVDFVMNRLPFPERAIFRKGYFPDTTKGLEDVEYALVSLDPDLYKPTLAGLEYFYPRLSKGGAIIIHDYNNRQFPGAHLAVDEFEKKNGLLNLMPLADLHGSCVIIK